MVAISEQRLEDLLTKGLELGEAEFHLEKLPGGKLSGSIISDVFDTWDDLERQRRIWDVLDRELGVEATRVVGTLLPYTRAEWDVDLPDE